MKTLALLQLGHLGLKGAKVEVAAADMVVEGAQILGARLPAGYIGDEGHGAARGALGVERVEDVELHFTFST